jgi:hypothetical protein
MNTKIISAFPGTGKSVYFQKNPQKTLDSDSSNWSWTHEGTNRVRHPDFPSNYISHIKENMGRYDVILVSSHAEVREALLDNKIFFYLVYPGSTRKEEFLERYRNRGNPDRFIQLVSDNWDNWMKEVEKPQHGYEFIRMTHGNLEDVIRNLV